MVKEQTNIKLKRTYDVPKLTMIIACSLIDCGLVASKRELTR